MPISEKEYQNLIRTKVNQCYDIAKIARSKGLDINERVEIPLANDMADRIGELLDLKGISQEIRDLSLTMSREEVALEMAKRTAQKYSQYGPDKAVDMSVRVGLAILTEGILVAPLEGISRVTIGKNFDGTDYVSVVYAGPIRGAGGTAQALSVLIADLVRRQLNIGKFQITDEEVERYIEEIQSYNRVKHLQYLPDDQEIKNVLKNCPVCIDGEGSEDEEISGHRDMERFKTNKIRGGMCLVLCEGLLQKTKKVLKHTTKLGISDWDFLEKSGKNTTDEVVDRKSTKFLGDLVAGRPVFGYPNRAGGFRLRYGRSRLSGLAAASIHPATMIILDDFVATGSQLKVELPGKAAAITPCDEIEGPMVLLGDGRHIRIRNEKQAREVANNVVEITDLGEILISYGDFLENNHILEPSPFAIEWWNKIALTKKIPEGKMIVKNVKEAILLSKEYDIPLHPDFNLFWHDLSVDEINEVGNIISKSISQNSYPSIVNTERTEELMKRLGVEYHISEKEIILDDGGILKEIMSNYHEIKSGGPMECICEIAGIEIRPRGPVRVGARLGRPEKAGERKMKPKVHSLFPIENNGSSRRSIIDAVKSSNSRYDVETNVRVCTNCNHTGPEVRCCECGSPMKNTNKSEKIKVDLKKIWDSAFEYLGLNPNDIKEFKGVKKVMSKGKNVEPLEKGILRSLNNVSVNKDGTCRYDMSDVPITHFKSSEIFLPEQKAKEIGYEPGMNEIFTQDIIIPMDCATYLLNVSRYVDGLLEKYYGMERFYNCRDESDLIGHIVIGLAPHTSGGIAGRIIGFSRVNGGYAHPFYHAAKRRNCDGDEDSVMLLMDGLLNFSKDFLPSTTGGLMDAPLVMTLLLKPDEVDKEALNVDSQSDYPLEFYESTLNRAKPAELEELMKPVKLIVEETGSARGISFQFSTGDLNSGVLLSSYKTLETMSEKIEKQLNLAKIIRAVDQDDVASRLINSHFLPDMFGNYRGFFSQEVRCTKCNTKYRRVPLSGKCQKCGNDNLILTIHRGGIVKYMEETRKLMKNFKLPPAQMYRIENIFRSIETSFNKTEDIRRVETHIENPLDNYGELEEEMLE
ncbi:MAG: DNA polymerase II large subunit [Candidatus Thermoplasmatota archaeon]|nr:DNA polymerase II large subunit [Candidatus Thermoplasmatota archaeon]